MSAKQLEANSKLISGVTTSGKLFTFIPRLKLSHDFGNIKKFSSTANVICAIDKQNQIMCYDS